MNVLTGPEAVREQMSLEQRGSPALVVPMPHVVALVACCGWTLSPKCLCCPLKMKKVHGGGFSFSSIVPL